jgi:hypothetical protein
MIAVWFFSWGCAIAPAPHGDGAPEGATGLQESTITDDGPDWTTGEPWRVVTGDAADPDAWLDPILDAWYQWTQVATGFGVGGIVAPDECIDGRPCIEVVDHLDPSDFGVFVPDGTGLCGVTNGVYVRLAADAMRTRKERLHWALHELGHVIGLGHVVTPGDLMNPVVTCHWSGPTLQCDYSACITDDVAVRTGFVTGSC